MIAYIEKLLKGQPVEWKTLGEVFYIRNGYTPSKSNKSFWEKGDIPWFRMEDIRTYGRILQDSILHITPEAIKGKGLFKKGSIILSTSATIGEHAILEVDALANQRFTNFEVKEGFKQALLSKYVYYYFFVIDSWCKRNVQLGNFSSIELDKLKQQQLPIPPLNIQEEIVRILDSFTELEAELEVELEAELEARRKQYEYYRNSLLSFDKPGGGVK